MAENDQQGAPEVANIKVQSGIMERIKQLKGSLGNNENEGTAGGSFDMPWPSAKHDRAAADESCGIDCAVATQAASETPNARTDSSNTIGRATQLGRVALHDIGECILLACVSDERASVAADDAALQEYLDSRYGRKWMAYTLCADDRKRTLGRLQVYGMEGFDVETPLMIARTAKYWLEICGGGAIVIEVSPSTASYVLVTLCALLRFTGRAMSVELAYHSLLRAKNLPFGANGTTLRYIKYFEHLLSSGLGDRPPRIALNQVIITVPTRALLGERGAPALRIAGTGSSVTITKNCYYDENFIIFSFISSKTTNDIVLELACQGGDTKRPVMRLALNTSFYQAGLYRFTSSEIELCDAGLREAHHGIFFDVIYAESNSGERPGAYSTGPNATLDISTMAGHLCCQADPAVRKRLAECGFGEALTEFFARLRYTPEESREMMGRLEALGYRNIACERPPVAVPRIEEVSDARPEVVIQPSEEEAPEPALCMDPAGAGSASEPVDLAFVQDAAVKKTSCATVGLSPFAKKSKAQEQKLAAPTVVAIKPLHWAPLTNTEETIFKEIEKMSVDLDLARFEELFCEKSREAAEEGVCSVRPSRMKDLKKLFIVSLSLRHLELKHITPESLPGIIAETPRNLTLQDLQNIERVLMTSEDREALEMADPASLSDTEQKVLQTARIKHIEQTVRLLVFERRFCEEIALHRASLLQFVRLANALLDSTGLRKIMSVVLHVGNAINFEYSTRRKRAAGFKLETLDMLGSYCGKGGVTLFDYVVDTAQKNRVEAEQLLAQGDVIARAKNTNLASIREGLNEQIALYKEQLAGFSVFDGEEQARFRYILGCACKQLAEASQLYKECTIYASILKKKFGELETRPVEDLLDMLHRFIVRLEAKYREIRS
ncbi:hypothetical protein PAPHI01_0546 [Pancytospora philotis]|nr:hypothetical protein PAPHI01_0546 [Pancytospora philotis]